MINLIMCIQKGFAGPYIIIKMGSTQNDEHRKMQIRMFRFLDLNWVQILTGEIHVDAQIQKIKIIYENSGNDHLIPSCISSQLKSKQQNQSIIQIPFSRINRVEQDETDKKIVYFWVDVDPFSISCLTALKAIQICQLLELVEQNFGRVLDQQGNGEINMQYLKYCLKENQGMISMLFADGKPEIVDLLMEGVENIVQKEATQEQKQVYFFLCKTSLRFCNKQIIQKMIEGPYYETLLRVLSWNTFNDKNFDYFEEYNKQVNFNNIVGIKNKQMLKLYETSARIKFLRDVAACMFIEAETDRVFQNIINSNNQKILSIIASSQETLNSIVSLSQKDPTAFLSVFVELWEIFRATTTEFQNSQIKQGFMNKIKQKNIHNLAVQAANLIVDNSQKYDISIRFHEKWIQSFNPFLSFDWSIAQEWLFEQKDYCLLKVILKLFNKCEDEGLIQTILTFVRWLIDPSDNRTKMQSKFKCYVYNEFLFKIWETMSKSTFLTEQYIQLIIKLYKADYIRTRRLLIQNRVMFHLQNQIQKKPILICVIRLLDAFLEQENADVFNYLFNNQLFMQLKQWHQRNREAPNIINSCFRSLLKKVRLSGNDHVLKYFSVVFFPQKTQKSDPTQNGTTQH